MKEIILTQGKVALIDDEDFDRVVKYKWYAWKSCDKKRKTEKWEVRNHFWDKEIKNYKTILLHRFIMNPKKGMVVDHINHDTLDNRKCNLRICTNIQNCWNRSFSKNNKSGYKGVFKLKNNFVSRIIFNGKYYHLGTFTDKTEAAKVYDRKAKELCGEFANTNEMLNIY